MTEQDRQSTGEVVQLVNFRLGQEEYAVDIGAVREITTVTDITRIQEASSCIYGVTNLRGQVIAVIDLAEQFGLPSRQELAEDAKIVVAEVAGQTVGMLVDEVPGVLSIQRGDIEPAPEVIRTQVKKDYIEGIGKVGERLFIILNLEKVLAPHEVEELVETGV